MGFKVAVVGATGNVGREMLSILAERAFPADEVIALASSRSVGTEVSYGDKVLKVQQQTLLHLMRVLATLCALLSARAAPTETAAKEPKAQNNEGSEAHALGQQIWAFVAASYAKLSVERREASLPGCLPQDGEVLFGPEEVKEYQAKKKVRDMRKGLASGKNYSFRSHCPNDSPTGAGFRGNFAGTFQPRFFNGKSGGKSFGRGRGQYTGRAPYTYGRGRGRSTKGAPLHTNGAGCPPHSSTQGECSMRASVPKGKGESKKPRFAAGVTADFRRIQQRTLFPQSSRKIADVASHGGTARSTGANRRRCGQSVAQHPPAPADTVPASSAAG